MDFRKKHTLNIGYLLVLFVSLVPAYSWKIGFILPYDTAWQNVALSFAKIGAFGGTAMFAVSLILSGRYRWFEKLFGGLDKLYAAHRLLGTLGLTLILIHPVSLSIARSDEGLRQAFLPWLDINQPQVFIGVLAFWGFISLLLWSIFNRAKYETFVNFHKYLGALFLLGVLHGFAAGSVLRESSFTTYYILVLSAVALFTYLTYTVFGDIFGKRYSYVIENVKVHEGNITEIEITPMGRQLRFRPGQFVYIKVEGLEDHGFHPFSISSGVKSKNLKLGIRESGDFTSRLSGLKRGTKIIVNGPYGGFILHDNPAKKQLWIAGGIGITPFLSGARSIRAAINTPNRVELIYASTDKHPYALEELLQIEYSTKAFNITLFGQDDFGFVSLKTLQEQILDFDERTIFVCGPPQMLKALILEAEQMGIAKRLNYEEFSY